jgi:hypothetical protein
MVPCTGESPPTGQVAKEGNFASQSSNKLTISTVNRLNLREAEQLLPNKKSPLQPCKPDEMWLQDKVMKRAKRYSIHAGIETLRRILHDYRVFP